MSREWQPGDVAKSVDHGYIGILVDGCWNTLHDTGQHWHNSEGGWDRADHPRRPLVVIDPEDREQIERLADELHHVRVGHRLGNCYPAEYEHMQAALRNLADPPSPRPDEPLLLGAVIEDEGALWVGLGTDPGGLNWCSAEGHWNYWDEFASPRVLSPGYDPEATT